MIKKFNEFHKINEDHNQNDHFDLISMDRNRFEEMFKSTKSNADYDYYKTLSDNLQRAYVFYKLEQGTINLMGEEMPGALYTGSGLFSHHQIHSRLADLTDYYSDQVRSRVEDPDEDPDYEYEYGDHEMADAEVDKNVDWEIKDFIIEPINEEIPLSDEEVEVVKKWIDDDLSGIYSYGS